MNQGRRPQNQKKQSKKTKSTKSSSSSCMSNAVKYMKQWKDVVGNFKRQSSRSTKHASVGSKKHGKKGGFAPAAHRLVEVGGDNKSNLSCGGSYDNEGTKQMLNLTGLLFNCEMDVNMSCNPANYPKHDDTMLNMCTNLTVEFETETEKCMKKTIGKTTTEQVAEACTCWDATSLANMSTSVADCKIQDKQKEITAQKQACTAAFAKCRKYEDEAIGVMATCSNTKDKLAVKAAALSANSAAVTAAKEKMSTLAGATGRRTSRQTATSCAEVITKSTSLTLIVSQSTSSSQITVIATEISSVSSSITCSDDEKNSLTTQISSVESALARITEALEAVQEQLTTMTGSSVSTGTTSTSVSTSAPSLRRDRILKTLLKK